MIYLLFFVYLLLGHLLADFVFQPKALVVWKHKDWQGVLVHALIVFAVSMLIFWPMVVFGNWLGIVILAINAGLHFAMDAYKIAQEHDDGQRKYYVKWFFLDQFFHIVVLLLVAGTLFMRDYAQLLTFFWWCLPFAIYLNLAVLCTYVYEIVKFQFLRQQHGATVMKFNYRAMFLRLVILSVIFGVVMK